MRELLLDRLCCPRCRASTGEMASVGLDRDAADSLVCRACDARYPIEGGVPRMLAGSHSREVASAFTRQWRLRREGSFENASTVYGKPHAERAESVRVRLAQSLSGEGGAWVLDAGCGSGEMVASLAEQYPRVQFVGLDFTDSVRDAARRWQHLENLHYVQGDVARPPLAPEGFDGVYSFGVLHHTTDTREAFSGVAQLVRSGGELSVWLYPHPEDLAGLPARERWGIRAYYALRDRVFLGRAHELPPGVLLGLLRALCAPALLVPRPREVSRTPGASLHRSLVFVLFDGLAPAYQHRPSQRQVLDWFEAADFGEVRCAPQDAGHGIGAYTATRRSGAVQRR